MFYIVIILGSIVGILLGASFPAIPYTYSIYVSVTIIAAIDSIFGGVAARLKNRFELKVFISGFIGNTILTLALVYLGKRLNLDIHLAAIVVFLSRIFNNMSIIRRYYIDVWYDKYEQIKKHYIHIKSDYEYEKEEETVRKKSTKNKKK